ncbi:MAG: sugar phosphate isomerase/epimerase [Bacteroidaceae bacterium]|jgi:sugar phosphate isomerase/epimerase|nr:sugar phosphate isomerase/epimerase [Bacteroidaceae bacterium]MBQ1633931.1 sugar phosphate isomerase/epimerase [Bacteroidaceae bacterium]MBQ2186865.1 sugar phosphate isomerase/epimerase [Bacteroidaceae bacterium]MBR6046965.1 sugar phosphate isomerase/epimerase [Bacteroidaceae bacterium]
MKRRNFLLGSMSGLAAASFAPTTLLASCAPKKEKKNETPLNICFQEGIPIGENLNEKLDYMESLGVTGLEVGGRGLAGRVDEIKNALQGRNIKLGAICAGFDGFILAEDGQKDAFDKSMREILEAAGKLGSCGVIMVPAFNGQNPCKPHTMDTRNYLCEQLHELGEFAVQCGTTVILEPLNRNECFYMRLVADAAAICRDSDSAGVKCMGDFWHMQEETSDYAAFMAAGTKYLQHVHIASRGRRKTPIEDGEKDDYRDGMRALKEMGYPGFISYECGCDGDKATILPQSVELLRKQWEEA